MLEFWKYKCYSHLIENGTWVLGFLAMFLCFGMLWFVGERGGIYDTVNNKKFNDAVQVENSEGVTMWQSDSTWTTGVWR